MILDIIAVIVIGLLVYKGAKNGFVRAIFGTLTLVLALILTSVTVNPVFEYVKNTSFAETIYENTQIEFLDTEDFEQAKKFLDKFEMEEIEVTDEMAEGVIELESELSLNIGDAVIRSVCTSVLFGLYFAIIKIAVRLLDVVCKLPVLKTFNKAGGFLAGVVNAYITMLILTCVIMLLMPTEAGTFLTKQLGESVITTWIYKTNPLI